MRSGSAGRWRSSWRGRQWRSRPLQVLRRETGVLGDAGQHAGTELPAIVERPDVAGPARVAEPPLRHGPLQLHGPAGAHEGGQGVPSRDR